MKDQPTALYRHFDEGGALLYVGISNDALRRLCQHAGRSHWFAMIRRVEVEWLPNRSAAMLAEAAAIAKEGPQWNIHRPAGRGTRSRPHVQRAPTAIDLAWYVFHPRSARLDGWYSRRELADEVRAYFAETWVNEVFEVRSRTRDEFFPIAGSGRWLAASNAQEWASANSQFGNSGRVVGITDASKSLI